jgi:hypothetical protein
MVPLFSLYLPWFQSVGIATSDKTSQFRLRRVRVEKK